MANPEHVAKLKEGWEAWNEWRETTDERPDLSGERIQELSLAYYNLTGTDFSRARVSVVSFGFARLTNCSFRNAFFGLCAFDACVLAGSDFTGATVFRSTFTHVSLSGVRGLEHLDEYTADNSIGLETFFESGGLPESLLRASGVPEEFIQYAASLVGKAIEYYSCFLSYSSKDDEFARRLYEGLQAKNVRTWFAPEDLKIGDRFRVRIDESIRVHDKAVIILSAHSVASDWVESEVEAALERERKEGRDVLFPIAIDDEGFDSQQPWAAHVRRTRQIGDFRKWKSHDDYTRAFDRLVRDLKKSQPPIIMRG
jgi:hypothetical protein